MDQFTTPGGLGRRKFIYDVSLTSVSVLLLSSLMGGCESILDAIRNRPVRRMIRNTAESNHATDLYRTAVAAMKKLPVADCCNWTKQARIHDDFCPHGNWFFFPWHRAYLFEFEKICQKLCGDPKFGLPYWNWCADGHIPAPFWPPPADNALYDSNRVATATDIASATSVGLPLVDGFCNEPSFTLFAGGATTGLRTGGGSYGNIEATPHNYIHGTFIRGDMATFMSPLDPIFWMHHCMVDLCWYEWNISRNHANTNDPNWINFNLSGMFCDANGNTVNNMPVLSTLLMPILSYRYETGIAGNTGIEKLALKNKADFESMKTIIQRGAKVELKKTKRMQLQKSVTLYPQRTLSESIPVDMKDFETPLTTTNKERIILSVKNISHPQNSDVFIRVFVNKPDATVSTSTDDIHYAGSFYFFTHGGPGHQHNEMARPDYYVDITKTLKQLQAATGLAAAKEITINIVTVPVEGVNTVTSSLTIEDLELFVSPVEVILMDLK